MNSGLGLLVKVVVVLGIVAIAAYIGNGFLNLLPV